MATLASSRTALKGAASATILESVYNALYAERAPKANPALTKIYACHSECSRAWGKDIHH